ncbi:MAG: M16 family metallopeptidase [Brachymonas sp.]|jgi:zinc protease
MKKPLFFGLSLLLTQWAVAALPIAHWQSPQGAQIYLISTAQLPMVDVRIDWDAGSRRDPHGKSGTAAALASMLDKGVTAQGSLLALDENAIADIGADLAVQIAANVDDDRLSISLRSLSKPEILQPAVALLARQIASPSLPPAVWLREQSKTLAALAEAQTRPPYVAQTAYTQAVYGQHPYGSVPSATSLKSIRVADLRQFHGQYLRACGARISIVGSLDRAQAEQISHQLLAGLPRACPPWPALPKVADAPAKLQRITLPAAQSQVLLGQIAIARDDPDFFPFLVGNHILGGGGFASLLMQKVREDQGLVYGIYSDFAPQRDRGAFSISFQTRPAEAERATQLSLQVLDDFVQHGPVDTALQAAKDNLIGGFSGRLDSNAKLLGMLANIAWNDLPLDYLDTWTAKIAAVQTADVRRAFARMQPKTLVRVEVGP